MLFVILLSSCIPFLLLFFLFLLHLLMHHLLLPLPPSSSCLPLLSFSISLWVIWLPPALSLTPSSLPHPLPSHWYKHQQRGARLGTRRKISLTERRGKTAWVTKGSETGYKDGDFTVRGWKRKSEWETKGMKTTRRRKFSLVRRERERQNEYPEAARKGRQGGSVCVKGGKGWRLNAWLEGTRIRKRKGDFAYRRNIRVSGGSLPTERRKPDDVVAERWV